MVDLQRQSIASKERNFIEQSRLKFVRGTFSNRENAKAEMQFRRERQS